REQGFQKLDVTTVNKIPGQIDGYTYYAYQATDQDGNEFTGSIYAEVNRGKVAYNLRTAKDELQVSCVVDVSGKASPTTDTKYSKVVFNLRNRKGQNILLSIESDRCY